MLTRHPRKTTKSPDVAGDSKAVITADESPDNIMRQTRETNGVDIETIQLEKIIKIIDDAGKGKTTDNRTHQDKTGEDKYSKNHF